MSILFLYREVLSIDLPWLNNIGRPHQTKRIPTVSTKDEVASLLVQMEGTTALLARLLYGTGMRLMEGLRLRHSFATHLLRAVPTFVPGRNCWVTVMSVPP